MPSAPRILYANPRGAVLNKKSTCRLLVLILAGLRTNNVPVWLSAIGVILHRPPVKLVFPKAASNAGPNKPVLKLLTYQSVKSVCPSGYTAICPLSPQFEFVATFNEVNPT